MMIFIIYTSISVAKYCVPPDEENFAFLWLLKYQANYLCTSPDWLSICLSVCQSVCQLCFSVPSVGLSQYFPIVLFLKLNNRIRCEPNSIKARSSSLMGLLCLFCRLLANEHVVDRVCRFVIFLPGVTSIKKLQVLWVETLHVHSRILQKVHL